MINIIKTIWELKKIKKEILNKRKKFIEEKHKIESTSTTLAIMKGRISIKKEALNDEVSILNLKREMAEDALKNYHKIVSLLSSIVLSLLTGFLVYTNFSSVTKTDKLINEQVQMREFEMSPQISLYDYVLEMIDQNGTPIKRVSWQNEIDSIETGSTKEPVNVAMLLRFINNSKTPGVIEWVETKLESLKKESIAQVDINKNTNKRIVPGNSKSGWSFAWDITPYYGMENLFYIHYKFKIHDSEDKTTEKNITLICDLSKNDFGYYNSNCQLYNINQK